MALHLYQRSRHSNAGNCECGMDHESRSHPHPFTQASSSNLCVRAYSADHLIHTDADTAEPNPVYPEPPKTHLRGIEAGREAIRKARGDDWAPQTPITFGPRNGEQDGGVQS